MAKRGSGQLFYYLNRTCFNGLCRFNKAVNSISIWSTQVDRLRHRLFRSRRYLKHWSSNSDIVNCWPLEPEEFVYADPPYDVEFTTYSAGGFSWADQVRDG